MTVRYQDEFDLREGGRSFELVAAREAPPSPLGLAFIIENQYDKPAR